MEGASNNKDNENKTESKAESDEKKTLCVSCINREYCNFILHSDKPVFYCEEYDLYNNLLKKYKIKVRDTDK